MVAEVLPPSVEDSGNSQGRLEVVPAELQQGGGGAGEQEGVEAGLVVADEQIQFVRQREDDVEVRDGQQELGLLLQPLGAVELLATGTMAVAARVRPEVPCSAMGTLVLVAAQRWGVTGGDVAAVFRGESNCLRTPAGRTTADTSLSTMPGAGLCRVR